LVFLATVGVGLIGACGPRQFPTLTIYEKPAAYVRLEFDRTVKTGLEHSHPISLAPEQVAAVLAGVRIEEAHIFVQGDVLAVFSEEDIAFFAPLIAQALSKARPEEVVSFYETRYLSTTRRAVTSGGLFVQGDVLHLILANYWAPIDHRIHLDVTDTQDDRRTPMHSLTTPSGHLDFEPHSAKWERPAGGFERVFQSDSRELTILYKQLPPHPLAKQAAPSVAVP
jgi:hypothetical protein